MKNENGITMMTLVVTVIVLFIISSITLDIGIESYKTVKMQNFISKLRVIQGKVDQIAEDSTFDVETVKAENQLPEGKTLNNDIDLIIESNGDEPADYAYFNQETLESVLGLKDIDLEVIINFEKRKVISLKGVKYEDQMYYEGLDAGTEVLIN